MSSLPTALIAFCCVFTSAMVGLWLRAVLPEHHLDDDSRDIVKLGTGLVATISALVLSLLISSAKSSFDKMNDDLVQSAAVLIQLDRTLAAYGPETRDIRDLIKRQYSAGIDRLFSGNKSQEARLDSPETLSRIEGMIARLRQLSPGNDVQRALQFDAIAAANEMTRTRWLFLLQTQEPMPMSLLVVLVSWLAIIFMAFGLFAPRNATVVTTLGLSALCAAGAIFLILEMNQPLTGFVRLSSAPMRDALAHLGE